MENGNFAYFVTIKLRYVLYKGCNDSCVRMDLEMRKYSCCFTFYQTFALFQHEELGTWHAVSDYIGEKKVKAEKLRGNG